MIFTEHDHAQLAALFDGYCTNEPIYNSIGQVVDLKWASYSGYKPEVREAPNGDTKECPICEGTKRAGLTKHSPRCAFCNETGRVPNVDAEGVCPKCKDKPCPGCAGGDGLSHSFSCNGHALCFACGNIGRTPAKRYLHVAPKHNPPAWAMAYLARAHYEACRVAEALNVPAAYYPRVADGTLRVLEYPPGAGTVEHKDFDLFTIVLWRSTPDDLERHPGEVRDWSKAIGTSRDAAEAISPGLHIGELGELVGLGPATPHRVPARPYAQKSIVYFAMPDHGARLPHTIDAHGLKRGRPTVGQWLKERIARSRY
jgi:hypothetical protein